MLKFNLDKTDSKVKLYHQLYLQFVDLIEKGELKEGDKMPSIRTLAENNDFSRNTITKAYEELEEAGYIYSVSKSGSYIKLPSSPIPEKAPLKKKALPTVDQIVEKEKEDSGDDILIYDSIDFDAIPHSNTFILDNPFEQPEEEKHTDSNADDLGTESETCKTYITGFGDKISINEDAYDLQNQSPEELLVESYKDAIVEQRNLLFMGPEEKDIQGIPSLRVAISSFLYEFHHLNVNPANIVVSSDLAQLLINILSLKELSCPKFKAKGLLQKAENRLLPPAEINPSIAIIEGHHSRLHKIFKSHNFTVKEVLSDEYGMDINSLITSSASLAFTSTMDVDLNLLTENFERRSDLLNWAKAEDYRYIFEYDLTSVPKTFNDFPDEKIEKNKLIYINSFRNLLSKTINASFAVLPDNLLKSYREKFNDFECSLSLLEQCALTDLIIKKKLINYLKNLEQL